MLRTPLYFTNGYKPLIRLITTATVLALIIYTQASSGANPSTHSSPTLTAPLHIHIKETIDIPKNCFTQGFTWFQQHFYLSCGRYGKSSVLKLSDTGTIIKRTRFNRNIFAEGLAIHNEALYVLSWNAGKAFKINTDTLAIEQVHSIQAPAWGMTKTIQPNNRGPAFIVSHGTSQLSVLTPGTFKPLSYFSVHDSNNQAITQINELESLGALMFANLWFENNIILFSLPEKDKDNTRLLAHINLDEITLNSLNKKEGRVLNGIAYDAKSDCLWITGKEWGKAYAIAVDLNESLIALSGVRIDCPTKTKR